ncbi:MAG: 6-bladed beta-propeller [Saprospiraceae bacterium]
MRFLRYGLTVFSALSLFNCGGTPKNNTDIERIDAFSVKARAINLTEIADSIRYIQLQAPDLDSYISNDWIDVSFIGDNIYIYQDADVYETLFHFSNTGEYISRINTPGEGPGKIVSGNDYLIDAENEFVEILDNYQRKIVTFDINTGEIVKEIATPQPFRKFKKSENNYLFFMGNGVDSPDTSGYYNLFLTDFEYNILQKEEPIPPYLLDYRIKDYNFSNNFKEEYLFKSFLSNKIYSYKEGALALKYIIDFGPNWVNQAVLSQLSMNNERGQRRKLLYDNKDHIYHIVNVLQTSKYVIFTYWFKEEFNWAFYDKETKKIAIYDNKYNNLDYGPVGQDRFLPITAYEDYLVFIIPSEDVKYHFESMIRNNSQEEIGKRRNTSMFSIFEKTVANLKEYDNPVLALVKLK